MSRHTPGPWRVEIWNYSGRDTVPTIQTDSDAVAQTCHLWRDGRDDSEEVAANARLIAAAPELLAFVQDAAGPFGTDGDPENWGYRARALLAKLEIP